MVELQTSENLPNKSNKMPNNLDLKLNFFATFLVVFASM